MYHTNLPISVAEEIRKHVYMNIDIFWSEASYYGKYMVWCPTGYECSQDQAVVKKSFIKLFPSTLLTHIILTSMAYRTI